MGLQSHGWIAGWKQFCLHWRRQGTAKFDCQKPAADCTRYAWFLVTSFLEVVWRMQSGRTWVMSLLLGRFQQDIVQMKIMMCHTTVFSFTFIQCSGLDGYEGKEALWAVWLQYTHFVTDEEHYAIAVRYGRAHYLQRDSWQIVKLKPLKMFPDSCLNRDILRQA